MTSAIPDILARIAEHKRAELTQAPASRAEIERRAADFGARRDFRAALAGRARAVIAEIKKASPSKGVLCADFDPPRIARSYEAGGAAALSVLTDARYFQGSLADLRAARAASGLPVLRKDFTLDEYHVVEAAAHGADAILLIAALFDADRLRGLRELAAGYGMAALVEVHDRSELDRAVDSGAAIVGVNNRDLRTFEVSLRTSLDLAARIPEETLKVSESGIQGPADIRLLAGAGYQAFLVGERLMTSQDPAAALRELAGAA